MKSITVNGTRNHQPITLTCSNIVLGSGDFLRLDNMEFAAPVLDEYMAHGGNTFDTARHYRHSEKALGIWMEMRGNRDKLNILTKGCHPVRENPHQPRVTPEAIEEDLMTSLEYLKTDHVELYALHRDDPTKPVGPIMEALHKQVEAGRIYAIGLSNWEIDRIIEADNYAKENRLTRLSFNSPNLSLAKPLKPRWENCVSANSDMVKWHEETGLPLFSWSSQAGGFFSGRFAPEILDDQEMVEVYYSEENWERYSRAKVLAEKKQASPIQIALSYVLNQSFPTAALIGSENKNELVSSISGASIELTPEEIHYLDLKRDELA
ncbi:aldo/keto reductase [Bacillus sp. S3]|uniref:aldo/keto reductase n=1 Tax=Bacillus sp. S3 TaxID=486398 RepID=UPI00118A5027|nr:aldo/keto reductase [Bacillus sp. S3]QCJ44303.1 aldo/keto reductase [Bacillus sp. S3]